MQTSHIRQLIASASEVALRADPGAGTHAKGYPGLAEFQGAVNKLRHAAAELEAEILEEFDGIPQS